MASVGAALIFVGAYMMYEGWKAYHNGGTAHPLTTAKQSIQKGKP
jgi:uncharacterized membrane protein